MNCLSRYYKENYKVFAPKANNFKQYNTLTSFGRKYFMSYFLVKLLQMNVEYQKSDIFPDDCLFKKLCNFLDFSKSLGKEVLPLKVTLNEVIAGSRAAG